MQRQATNLEKIFAKHEFDKGLITKIHKELVKIQQHSILPNFKMGERSEQTSHQRRHMSDKHLKDIRHHL